MKKIPEKVSITIRDRLWKQADEAGWTTLKSQQKTAFYEQWSKAPGVGNVLEAYLDGRSVRVYIKDVIMKPYGRSRIKDPAAILKLLNISPNARFREQFVKPHGRILDDGKTLAWGQARDWKSVLFAVYERAFRASRATPYAVILMNPDGKMYQPFERKLVEDAAKRLGISVVLWPDFKASEKLKSDTEPTLL